MKPSDISATLAKIIPTKRPVILHGPPGVGKSALWNQAAASLEMEFKDVRAIYYDPTEVSGMPFVSNGEIFRSLPELLKGIGDKPTIVCFDDFLQAPQLTLNAMSQLVLDRQIGPHRVPDNVYFGAATNDQEHMAATNRMPMQLVSRFIHIYQDVDIHDWVKWALGNDIITQDIAFIRFRPELLFQFDPKVNKGAYPCPRTWEINSDVFKAYAPQIPPFEVLSGIVGEGPATERLAFEKVFRKLQSPDKILLDPENVAIPENDPSAMYATVGALARKASEQTIGRIVKYANRLPPEFSALLIRDCAGNDKGILETRPFIEWSSDHQDILI